MGRPGGWVGPWLVPFEPLKNPVELTGDLLIEHRLDTALDEQICIHSTI